MRNGHRKCPEGRNTEGEKDRQIERFQPHISQQEGENKTRVAATLDVFVNQM